MLSSNPRFTPPSPAMEKKITALLAKLSLQEKITLLGGHPTNGCSQGNARIGLPEFRMSDGPVGVHWHTKTSTTFPSPIAVAAAWDPRLAFKVGQGIGRDARARGIHILLAPGVNIYRSPLCSRNFEYCGEDPFLAGRTAAACIAGVQNQGVAATVKHYAVNFQEYNRHHVSSDLDERTLHEIYLPAFKAAVEEGGCGCVMTAYNLVNGVHASEHDYLINQVLKGEWGFDGVVMSDWVSVYSTVDAANAGLDLEMPVADWFRFEKLTSAIASGAVREDTINDKVRRLLRLGMSFGWMDGTQEDASIPMDDPQTAAVALDAARAGIVLLKNDGILPLDRKKIKTLAVVGPNAHPAVIAGGGSAWNPPNHQVSVLDGIRRFVGDRVEIRYACGPIMNRELRVFETCVMHTPDGADGLAVEYFNNSTLSGEPACRRIDPRLHIQWGTASPAPGVSAPLFSARWRGVITPKKSGPHTLYTQAADGGCRVIAAGVTVIDTWESEAGNTQCAKINLVEGVDCPVEIQWHKTRYWAHMHFGWEDSSSADREMAEALEVVRTADAAIVCTGFDHRSEAEGFDRTFAMPDELDRFVGEVAKVNPNTIAVIIAGGNIDMNSWIGSVRGLLHAWYPGQEGGTAVAEALFGAINPCGKLPVTFERNLEDRSSHDSYHDTDNDKRVTLSDGIFCGYRHADTNGPAPLFPFGFGLSYTTFSYRTITLSRATMKTSDRITASFDVTNTGKRAGAEVAQLYVRDMKSSLPRPVKELKGFARVELAPGEKKTVRIELSKDALSYYDPAVHGWVAEPGEFEVLIGGSSRDIKLRAKFSLIGSAKGRVNKKAARKVTAKNRKRTTP